MHGRTRGPPNEQVVRAAHQESAGKGRRVPFDGQRDQSLPAPRSESSLLRPTKNDSAAAAILLQQWLIEGPDLDDSN